MSQLEVFWGEARCRYTEVAGLDPDDSQFPRPSSIDELLRNIGSTKSTYGMHLIRRAFDARIGTGESNRFINALQDVYISNKSLIGTISDYSVLPLQAMILAVWNKSIGKHEEADAVLRPFVETATSGVYEDSGIGTSIVNFVIAKFLIATGDGARAVALMQTYSAPGVATILCYGRCSLLPDR